MSCGKQLKDLIGKDHHAERVVEKMDEVNKMKKQKRAIEKELQTLAEELERVVEKDKLEFSKTRKGGGGSNTKSTGGNNYSMKNPPPNFGVKGLTGPASEKCQKLMSMIARKERDLRRLTEKTTVKDAEMMRYVQKGPPNNPKKPKTMAEWRAVQAKS